MRRLTNISALAASATVMISMAACSHHEQRQTMDPVIESAVNSLLGKQLQLDCNLGYFTATGDSADAAFPDTDYTILRYIGPEGCTSCKMHLDSYAYLLPKMSEAAGKKIGFVCIVNPSDMDELRYILQTDNEASLPVWIDRCDTLNKINSFPANEKFQSFLIDRDHRILAVGDPAVNPRVRKLITYIISNDTTDRSDPSRTSLRPDRDVIELGDVAPGDTVTCDFIISNTGTTKYVLEKLTTSCDCTTAQLSSDTIHAGGDATLHVIFSDSQQTGEFYRLITMYGNTDEELVLEITGTIK